MENWTERYWGAEVAKKLQAAKAKYDPNNVFGCHNCITAANEHSHSSTVILLTVVGVVGLAILCGIIFLCRRMRNRKLKMDLDNVEDRLSEQKQ